MRPCDEPRMTPDWVPQAAPGDICGRREYGREHEAPTIPAGVILGEN